MSGGRYDYERDPAQIYRRSFSIVREEADLSGLPEALHPPRSASFMPAACPRWWRIWPGAAMSRRAVGSALAAGAPVFADVRIVCEGVIRKPLAGLQRSRLHAQRRLPCPGLARRLGTTRSAAAVDLWRDRWREPSWSSAMRRLHCFICWSGSRGLSAFRRRDPRLPVGFVARRSRRRRAGEPASTSPAWCCVPRGGSAIAARRDQRAGCRRAGRGHGMSPRRHGTTRPLAHRDRPRRGWRRRAVPRLPRQALADAKRVFGGARHGELVCPLGIKVETWPSPFHKGLEALLASRGEPVAVLASGDPMWFGIGSTLARSVPHEEMLVLPAPSSLSLAAARLGWPLQDVETLSLHGRPVDLLRAVLHPGAKVLCLTSGALAAEEIARPAGRRGLWRKPADRAGASRRTGRADPVGQRRRLARRGVATLNVVALEAVAVRARRCARACPACRTMPSAMTARSRNARSGR